MKATQFSVISIALDTSKYSSRPPRERERIAGYFVDRLLAGDEVADSELRHYGLNVTIREAVKPEII
jgi:hypothetical protein